MESVFKAAVEELDGQKPMVVATVVRTSGSTPQKSGAKLLVREDGSGVGTLGGGCVEGDIWFAAQELLKRGGDGTSRLRTERRPRCARRPRLRRHNVLPHRPRSPT